MPLIYRTIDIAEGCDDKKMQQLCCVMTKLTKFQTSSMNFPVSCLMMELEHSLLVRIYMDIVFERDLDRLCVVVRLQMRKERRCTEMT